MMESTHVRAIRDQLGYTQARLSALLGVHALTVSRWERGALFPTPEGLRLLHAVERALALEPTLPARLRRFGADPIRELTAILAVLHPDLAAEAVCSRADAEAIFARAVPSTNEAPLRA